MNESFLKQAIEFHHFPNKEFKVSFILKIEHMRNHGFIDEQNMHGVWIRLFKYSISVTSIILTSCLHDITAVKSTKSGMTEVELLPQVKKQCEKLLLVIISCSHLT